MSSAESACLVTDYYYFPDDIGEYAAGSPLKHEALIWSNINSKIYAKSYKQNNKNHVSIRFSDFHQLQFLFSFCYPPLFMVGHTSANDEGKSVHTSTVMTFILNFYSFVKELRYPNLVLFL